MKQPLFFVLVVVLISTSCKKDKVTELPAEPDPPITYANFSQLKVGNYWIYERFFIDENGVAEPNGTIDSCYIIQGPQINGKQYFELVQPSFVIPTPDPYLRDSLQYLVNSHGEIQFSSTDFNTAFISNYIINFGDTVAYRLKKMEEIDALVSTPAGDFVTSDARTTYYFYPGYDDVPERYQHARYAENVGLVIQTGPIFIGSLNSFERRLVRYHIEH